MKNPILLAAVAWLAAWSPLVTAQQADFDLKEWAVEWGGRTRDPAIAPDGRVWFVGQEGNYIAVFDPKTVQFKRYEIEEGTNPHTVIVDEKGVVWYAGNRNNRIGRLDPATGAIKTIMTGEATDPHTMVFDGKGNIWFTSQGANRVGRLNVATEKVDLVTPYEEPSNPYGIVLDPKGRPWVALLRTNMVAMIDPGTHDSDAVRPVEREVTVAADRSHTGRHGMDRRRGPRVSHPDQPCDERNEGVAGAGGRRRPPVRADQGRSGATVDLRDRAGERLVGFDPKTEQFFANISVSGTIRHMFFDPKTKMLWFGTDANKIGRINTMGKPTS